MLFAITRLSSIKPAFAEYLVLPSIMASHAAFLICKGGITSGSPKVKCIVSVYAAAISNSRLVGDGFICFAISDMSIILLDPPIVYTYLFYHNNINNATTNFTFKKQPPFNS